MKDENQKTGQPRLAGPSLSKSIFDKLPTIFKLFKKFENRFDWTQ